jgi:hypothetical protein
VSSRNPHQRAQSSGAGNDIRSWWNQCQDLELRACLFGDFHRTPLSRTRGGGQIGGEKNPLTKMGDEWFATSVR